MNVNYDFVVDFARPSKSNTLIVSENDNRSRTLHFVLLANNQPLDMSDVSTAVMSVQLPGNESNIIVESMDIETSTDSSGNEIMLNEVSCTLTGDITQLAGRATATITLQSSAGARITSFEFYIDIRNKLYTENDFVSDGTKNNLMDLIAKAQESVDKINEKWKEIVEQGGGQALPTPYPLVIKTDAGEENFTGLETKMVDLANVTRWLDNIMAEEIVIDESFVGNIAELRAEIEDYATQCAEYALAASSADAAAVVATTSAQKAKEYAEAAEKYNPTSVEVEALMEGGREIANISVNGEITTIYAPSGGGGSGEGTSDYDELYNLPKINGVTLTGDKSTEDLGIQMPSLDGYATTDWVAGYAQSKLTPGQHVSINEDGQIDIERTSVTVNQTQQPGSNSTKIATITVNGSATDIYAPKAQAGGGETIVNDNYNDLQNRPTFENKVIEGNLTKSFFGIATKTSDLTNDSHVSISRSTDSVATDTTTLADGGEFTAAVSTHDSYGHSTGYVATKYKLPSYSSLLEDKASQEALNTLGNRVSALEGKVSVGTLATGSSTITLTFQNTTITSDSIIDIYTDKYGLNPQSVTVNASSIVLTFATQTSNTSVKAIVR